MTSLVKPEASLMVCTPMYGGMCTGAYTNSMLSLATECFRTGLPIDYYFTVGESEVQRARNSCCREFLKSDCTHLLFIDADIGFVPQDVFDLLALSRHGSPYDIVAGPYPRKVIAWEKVKLAVEKGLADQDPNELQRYIGDYAFDVGTGRGDLPVDSPVEVWGAGTGFMMIRRQTLEAFAAAYPQYKYRDWAKDGATSTEVTQFFQSEIAPELELYLSEDFWFCKKSREIGLRTWACPWMSLTHTGSYTFGGGSPADLAAIGAPWCELR